MKPDGYELWTAIKKLYQWRKQSQKQPTVYDLLERGYACGTEAEREAYNKWKAHKNEEVFFRVNYLAPDDTPLEL